jgi:glycosyltransferase involved in cell wall biosynthesis
MSGDIRKRKLLVVSDTPFYRGTNGLMAFEPVVRELESLLEIFDEIVWLGCSVSKQRYAMIQPKQGIRLVAMPSVANATMNWQRVLCSYPVFLYHILTCIKDVTHVHGRAPSHPALLLMLLSVVDKRRRYWHKYAGNWAVKSGAISYRLQQWILKKGLGRNRVVTVNGLYEDSPGHIIAFENPCFTDREQQLAIEKAGRKVFPADLELLFVGGLNENKGIMELMAAIALNHFPARIKAVHIVGDGPLKDRIVEMAANTPGTAVHVHGYLSRQEVEKYYEQCHLIVLPSQSEGFPKVIAEASAYGCIPVVSAISCIPQYIYHGENGFLLHATSAESIAGLLYEACNSERLPEISRKATQAAARFTYEYYLKRIRSEIFCLQ